MVGRPMKLPLFSWAKTTMRENERIFYQASPPSRRTTQDRRMGEEFWEIERPNKNTSAPELAKAN